jgi:P-type Cu+ transporter
MMTGESLPQDKSKGSRVFAGTINKEGSLIYKAKRVGKDTTLSRIIRMIEEAQGRKAPVQRFADVISGYFVPIVIGISVLTFFVWVLLGQNIGFATLAAVAVLVIACPCALGLATPTAIMVGTGKGAGSGILIRSGEALENASRLKHVVLDKTGTVTMGKPVVTDIIGLKMKQEDVLKIAASLEAYSEHPLAKAVIERYGGRLMKATGFRSIPGKGVTAMINGKAYSLGNRRLVKEELYDVGRLENEGKTVMILAEKNAVGIIAVADVIRPTSKEAVRRMARMGINVHMITGDNTRTANAIASQAGIENVLAEVLPEDKAGIVRKLQKDGRVAMVGDGINDAPALAQADIGIAMGGGTDVAMESGNVVIMRDDLLDVVKALRLSRLTMSKIRQNMFWALIYNVIGIPIAAGVLYYSTGWLLSPILAGAAMALSSVSVVTNSLLLKAARL